MKVEFNELNTAAVTLHQWDFGVTLEFEGIPQGSEMHFPVPDGEELAVVPVENGACTVPTGTLTMNKSSQDAYLYVRTPDSGTTV